MGKTLATQNEEVDKQQDQTPEEVNSETEEEAPVGDPAPAVADPFLDRKASRLATVQAYYDPPKPVTTSDVTEEGQTEDTEKKE